MHMLSMTVDENYTCKVIHSFGRIAAVGKFLVTWTRTGHPRIMVGRVVESERVGWAELRSSVR